MAGAFARRDLLVPREQRSFSPFIGRRSRAYFAGMSRFTSPKVVDPLRSGSKFHGKRLVTGAPRGRPSRGYLGSGSAQMTLSFKKAVKWWEKGLQSNMNEIGSAEDLADSLKNAGDKLVIVHFFSPGCAGCRALHPKICQLAELNPEVLFLHINYEEHKSMCYSLHVHVLPFFRFYRGAHGRLCSFSCTNATIKKFKDALAKHLTDRCSLGPTKGLEESELLSLAENKDISFTYTRKPAPVPDEAAESTPVITNLPLAPPTCRTTQESVDKAALAAVSR